MSAMKMFDIFYSYGVNSGGGGRETTGSSSSSLSGWGASIGLLKKKSIVALQSG